MRDNDIREIAASHAPIFVFDSREEFFPESPMAFLMASRFRHHRGGWFDQGWSTAKNKWITGDSHEEEYYNIPVQTINSFKSWPNGENRRPYDPNSGPSENVFLQPRGRRHGAIDPNDTVPAYYHVVNPMRNSGLAIVIKYWIFHGYSDGFAELNHQGDWEGIAISFDNALHPSFVSYAAHGSYPRVAWRDVSRRGNRVISFVEKATHANFAVAPSNWQLGREWDVLSTLEPLADQPWKDFAGAWGEVGSFAGTTGPLGPQYKPEY